MFLYTKLDGGQYFNFSPRVFPMGSYAGLKSNCGRKHTVQVGKTEKQPDQIALRPYLAALLPAVLAMP